MTVSDVHSGTMNCVDSVVQNISVKFQSYIPQENKENTKTVTCSIIFFHKHVAQKVAKPQVWPDV